MSQSPKCVVSTSLPLELFQEILAYAQTKRLSRSAAVVELVEEGLRHLKDKEDCTSASEDDIMNIGGN